MTDQSREVSMTSAEKLDSARTAMVAEAVNYMAGGYLPNGGRGTVATEADGTQKITGVNDDQYMSTINWEEKPSRTQNGGTIVDKNSFAPNVYLKHIQISDSKDPTSSDLIELVGKGGSVGLKMEGTCTLNGSVNDCNYTVTDETRDESGKPVEIKGTAHIVTNEKDVAIAKAQIYNSSIDVNTTRGALSANLSFNAARDTATYEYKRSK